MGETSWAFLLVGTFAAVGAAMMVGTLAALWRYHRTGRFPGNDEVARLSVGKLVSLWVRVGVGLVLTITGVVAIERAGLL